MIFRATGVPKMCKIDENGDEYQYMVELQGCLKKCADCPYGTDIFPIFGGVKADTDTVIKHMMRMSKAVTIRKLVLFGGEAFLQPGAMIELCLAARKLGMEIEVRSGYSFEEIVEWNDARKELLKQIDILVEGLHTEKQRTVDVKRSLEKNNFVVEAGYYVD